MAQTDARPSVLETFTGRSTELERLRRELGPQGKGPVWVVGLAGIGKTTLLLAHAALEQQRYTATVHISASDVSDVRTIPAIIVAKMGAPIGDAALSLRGSSSRDPDVTAFEDVIARVQPRKPVLLVVDDLDVWPRERTARLLRAAERWGSHVRLVLISRVGPFRSDILQGAFLGLSALTLEESFRMLRRRFVYLDHDGEIARAILDSLRSTSIDGHRLTPRFLLRVANAFLRNRDAEVAIQDALAAEFREVTNLIVTPEAHRLAVVATSALAQTEIVTPSSRLLTAAPLVIVPTYQHFWRAKLDRLEELINATHVREHDLQQFFEENEILLRGIEYERVIAHPVLKRDDDGDLIPDFFLKPINKEFIDILDLKMPKVPLIVGTEDRKRVSAAVSEAIAQVREYREYFERPQYRERVMQEYGVTGYKPGTVVVIGRTPDNISLEAQQRVLDDLPKHVRLVTYDDLVERMRASMWAHNT